MSRTIIDRILDAHTVGRRADGKVLVYMDRTVLDDVRAPHAFGELERRGHAVRRRDLTLAVQDHSVATAPGRAHLTDPDATAFVRATRAAAARHRVRLLDVDDPEQGISHVVAPELGMVLPGATHACADSHAPTVGGVGALGFGCGTSELVHLLATQVMALDRPKTMRVRLAGTLAPGVGAKDIALRLIATLGVDAGRGFAIEFAGPAARALPVEGRFTLCNMATEMGARSALVAPDDATLAWLAGRPFAPAGADWEHAAAHWRTLATDDDAVFDREASLACDSLAPQVTWGTDPSQAIAVSDRVPDPATVAPDRRAAHMRALDYMGLVPGMPIADLPIHRVFIGSCTNARLSDLESAAAIARGRRVADGVSALIVPGSTAVKRAAEARGLDRVFRAAGFGWEESGCSICAGGNRDGAHAGERCVATTNRNFEGRQGRGVRTHLVSPAMAAAAAVSGRIVDVRRLMAGAA